MSDSSESTPISAAGDRLAKVIARAGLCSRREAEDWIRAGRVVVNGQKVISPAFNVTDRDKIKVDGAPLAERQGTRVWLYHKPPGLVVTEKDPEGRETIFDVLAEQGLPRVLSIGRLDINTEGLLLLTNDGGLKRVLELPATGWMRRYRVRAFGSVTQAQLDALQHGVEVDGIRYGPIEASFERQQGANAWLIVALREGKNREVKNVLAAIGLQVNRLIRISYGPFQLGDLPMGAVEAVKARVLRDQLGKRLAVESGADFDSPMPDSPPTQTRDTARSRNPADRLTRIGGESFKFADRPDRDPSERPVRDAGPRPDRPGRGEPRRPSRPREEAPAAPPRRVLFEDGEIGEFTPKPVKGDRGPRRDGSPPDRGPRKSFGDRPAREGGDRGPRREFGDRPPRPDGDRGPRRDGPASDRGPRRDGPASDRGPPREFGDRPTRPFDPDRPKRPYDPDRPKRPFNPDRPPGGGPKFARNSRPENAGPRPSRDRAERPKREFSDRPKRDFGDRPPRNEGGDRPARDFSDRPKRPFTGSKREGAPSGDRPTRGPRPEGGAQRPGGYRPGGYRPGGGRPSGDRPGGDRPGAGRPTGGRPGGGGGGSGRPPRKPRV